MLEAIEAGAEYFIGIFQEGAGWFGAVVVGIIPLLIILLTGVNALIAFIGQERINKFAELAGRPGWQYSFIRYLALPVVAVVALTNPMAYTMGTFVPEKNKPAFYDAAVSFVHPPLGILPHVNPGELFVWLGIATGISAAGLSLTPLAVRYLLVGLVVIYLRGLVTQFIVDRMIARREAANTEPATA
ncbi:MAG: PTS glucitol/sorbitol transporter subunit IIC [Nitriliruptoraceae bacterium]|nr:PTS glucitol/sorbitol transporter subunit IIC [Nitriliruptoraceae bacterium]